MGRSNDTAKPSGIGESALDAQPPQKPLGSCIEGYWIDNRFGPLTPRNVPTVVPKGCPSHSSGRATCSLFTPRIHIGIRGFFVFRNRTATDYCQKNRKAPPTAGLPCPLAGHQFPSVNALSRTSSFSRSSTSVCHRRTSPCKSKISWRTFSILRSTRRIRNHLTLSRVVWLPINRVCFSSK